MSWTSIRHYRVGNCTNHISYKPFVFQDAGAGDSGAPIYTLGNELPSERTNITLVGLHAGGLSTQSGRDLQRAKVFFPKWNVRVCFYAC